MATDQQERQEVWVSIPEAGARLGLNRTRSYELFTTGRLPGAVKLSERTWRVHFPSVEAHLLSGQSQELWK